MSERLTDTEFLEFVDKRLIEGYSARQIYEELGIVQVTFRLRLSKLGYRIVKCLMPIRPVDFTK